MTTSEKRENTIHRRAELLYSENPDWVTFYREILGLHGIVRRNYPTRESLTEFEQTEAYLEIQQMLTRLRKQRTPSREEAEPTKVITVRLPKSLHEALRVEAHEHHTSMNKLCISKLLQFIDRQMIPVET
jgi:predicted HicB family RNase H-like nuclease